MGIAAPDNEPKEIPILKGADKIVHVNARMRLGAGLARIEFRSSRVLVHSGRSENQPVLPLVFPSRVSMTREIRPAIPGSGVQE